MPGANEKVTITVDILGDISKFQNSVKAMQTELGKLQLPNNIKDSFTGIFGEIEREISKIQTIGGKKKIELIDSRNLTKSFSTLEGLYNKLINKMQSNKISTSIFEHDAQAISKVQGLLSGYEGAIKKIESDYKDLNSEVDKWQKKVNEATAEKSAKNSTIEQLKIDLAQLTEGTDEYIKKQKELNSANKAYTTIEEKIQKNNQLLDEAKQNVEKFQQSNEQLKTQAWDELLQKIQQLKGVNWEDFGINPSEINSVEQLSAALTKMGEAATNRAAAGLRTARTEAESAGSGLNSMVTKAEQAAQSLRDLGDRQHDIQQLASRLTHFFSLTNQFMIMRRIIQNAITTIKELDKAMTETAVVTDFNVADMWAQLPEYTKVANELGATTKGAYETMTLFYQQGLNQQQAFQLGTETMKMARIAGLDYAEATDRMTNALRGFNMELNDTSSQRVNDVYSNLAAKSASNVDELSTAMTKTASIAHAANMEFETTAAFLAQIIETTRESAETAGTALKTVIARFSEVKKLYSEGELTGQDEEGEQIDVNRVSTALRAAGVNLNEYLTGAKGLDEVFIELASKWDSLDLVTQRYIATMAAGSRQQSRFIALMQDYGRQTELVGIAQNSAGASTQQFEKTLDSLEAKLNKLENAWNEFTMGIANSSLIKGAIDLITGLITAINKVTAALGPVGGAITKVLLLFAGFKGIRALFDKFVGRIATVYVNAAKAAAKGGATAGTAYGNSFLVSSKKALNKFKNVFVDVTSSSFNINSKAIQDAQKALQQYTAAQIASAEAKDLVIQKEGEEALATSLSTDAIAARTAATEADNATTAYKNALVAMGVTNEEIQSAIISGEIPLQELLTAAESEEAKATLLQTLADNGYTEAQLENVSATVTNIAAQNSLKTTSTSLFKTLAAGILVLFGHKTAEEAMAAAGIKATGATVGLTNALKALHAAAIPLLIIAAAIAAIGIALKVAEETSLDGKLEDAANLAKSLDDELKAVQSTLDEFDEHTSSIETLKNELSELTTGTQEWKNKVQELNNEYIELSKLIGSDFWQNATIENGAINVDDKYLEQAYQKIIDKQIKLQQESIQASMITTDLNAKKSGNRLLQSAGVTAQEMFWNPDQYNGLINQVQNLSAEDLADLMGATTIEDFNNKTAELFNGLTFDTDSVKEAQTNLQNFIDEVNNGTAQMDASMQLMASDLQDKTINKESYGKVFASLQGDSLQAVEEIGAEVDKWLIGAPLDIANDLNKKAKELNLGREVQGMVGAFDEYVRIMNEAYGEGTFKVEGTDIKKRTEEGNYEKVDIGAGEVAQRILTDWINEQDFEGAYKEKINEIQEAMGDSFQGKEGREALERIIGGTFTQEDIEGMGSEVFNTLQEQLKKNELEIEIAPVLVEGGEQGFIDELKDKITDSKLDISAEDLLGATTQKGQEAFFDLFKNQITGNKNEFAKAFMGLDNFTDAEEFASIMEHLGDIDFSNKADWEALPEWLEEMDINIPNDALEEFVEHCIELAEATGQVDLTQVYDQLSTLYSSLNKVRSGDILASGMDKDTYESLMSTGQFNADDFEYNMYTGEYVYLEGQDSLETAIQAAIEAINGNTQAYLEEKVKANEGISDTDREALLNRLEGDTLQQQLGIGTIMDIWKANNVDVNALQIKGLNSSTDVANLSPEQAESISSQIAALLINGIEGAQAELNQYNQSVGYSNDYATSQESGYTNFMGKTAPGSDIVDSQMITQAAAEVENLSEKMDEARAATDKMGVELSELELKALVVDTDKAQKAMQNLGKAFSDTNKDVLEAGRSLDNYQEYDKALSEVAEAGQELFGKGFDASYVANNLELINQLLNGTEQESYEAETAIRMAMNPELVSGLSGALTNLEGDILSVQEYINGIPDEIAVNGYADVSQMVNAFIAAGATAEQALAKAEALSGFQITSDWVISGWVKKPGPKVKMTGWAGGGEQQSYVWVPQYTFKTNGRRGSVGGGGGRKGSGGGGGGGGGGGKTEEPEDNRDWKNPYDKLYNEYAKLEELQRKRNNLEKEFALLVDTSAGSVAKTTQQFKEQLKNLQAQADTQEKIVSGKKSQIANAQNKTYSVEDHVVKSYATAFKDAIDESNKSHGTSFSSNLADYAKYNTSTGQMEIDWNQIQSLEGQIDSAAGEVLEAYVSELEGLEDQLEEAQDGLIDIKTEIKTLVDQAMEDRIAYVDAMREAMISQYQKQIDKLSALNDAINESNQRIFDSLQQQIDLERQIRDNTKTEDEIAKNEARLAYLQRDTSGANDLEIQKLQQTLADQRENYSDTLVDQELARLQDQADEAAAQREHQIELMEDQLQFWQDTGYFEELIDKGISEGKAMEIYKDYTDYANKTRAEQAKIMQDFYGLFNKGGSANTAALAAADAQYNGGKYKVKDSKGNTYDVSYDAGTGTWKGKGANGQAFSLTAEQITSADTNKKILSTSVNLSQTSSSSGASSGSGGGGGGNSSAKTEPAAPSFPYGKASDTTGNIKKGAKGNAVKAIQYALNKLGYGNSGTKSVDGVFGSGTANAVKAFQKAMGISADGIVGKNTRAKFKAKGYSTGGLADYTGPAWLHGSPSKPELVLNAKDTENFIQLKNTLADVAKDSKNGSSGGDNYFDIKVEVGEIGSDYDVEKMITKIKDEIDQDARYRNVNSINFIR